MYNRYMIDNNEYSITDSNNNDQSMKPNNNRLKINKAIINLP